jgi:hypothetical protein
VPKRIVVHHADIDRKARTWFGAVPATTVSRTLNDCARGGTSPEFLRHAAQQALQRGLTTKRELPEVAKALKPFGGLAA